MGEEIKDTKKKPATRKSTAKKKAATTKVEEKAIDYEAIINQLQEQIKLMQQQLNIEKESAKVKPKSEEKWTKAKLYTIRDEMVEVRNVYNGKVVYNSPKTKINYSWLEKGDIEVMSIEEILTMHTKRKYLEEPWLAIDDERVIEGLGLEKAVNIIEKIEDTDSLVEMDIQELEKLIDDLNRNQRINLRDEVVIKIKANEIRDYATVVALKELLDIEDIDLI